MSDEAREHIPADEDSVQDREPVDTYLEEKRAWVRHHQQRRPVYPPTGERGTFIGIFGYRMPVGACFFPYYQTPGGIYFYEWVSDGESGAPRAVYKKTCRLHVEGQRRRGATRFFTAEQWLNP